MTGPGHYEQAEKCLGWAEGEYDRDKRASLQARAQVHATLALAEATVATGTMRPEEHDEWDRATGRLS